MDQRQEFIHDKFRQWTEYDFVDFISRSATQTYGMAAPVLFDKEEIDHIVQGLRSMINTLSGIQIGGDFIRSLLKKNFYEAIARADSTNIKAIQIYASFMYNELPSDCHNMLE